jgi:glycosyltransferase involved in cell wall biosynthesis
LFVGSFEARKNLAGVVRAYGRAASDGLALDLVVVATSGSGPTAQVDAAVRECGLRDRVRFIEGRAIGDVELHGLYAQAEMFVFPSLAESFGLPPLEAMAAGAPVIASGLPALREVLGDAALFVDGHDERGLAHAMLRLAADPAERERMSRAGIGWARRYSWETCAAETLAVYRRASGAPDVRSTAAALVGRR